MNKPKPPPRIVFSMRLAPEIAARVFRIAKRRGVTASKLTAKVVEVWAKRAR